MFSTAVPVAARANHGAATVSTKASATSFRQTNELHSGCSTLAMASDDDPLGGDGNRARHCAGDEQNYAAQQSREPESDCADQCFECKTEHRDRCRT